MSSIPCAPAERESADQVRCWQCHAVHGGQLFCPDCEAILPLPARADYFQILGIERRLRVDSEALERRYFELSRRLHPDLYQTGPAPARIASLGNTAALNRAYRALRDPIARGVYWLGLHGESLGANNNRVPPALAALVFEVQEKLEELRDRNGAGEAEITHIRSGLVEQRTTLLAQLDDNFARWDAAATDVATLTQELKAILSAIKYLGTLIRDVEKELER